MPNIRVIDGGSEELKIASDGTEWVIYVEEHQLLVPGLADTDIFGIAFMDDHGSDITDWYAFFIWDDNKWIRVDHWDDLSDDQKCTLARWYYSKWDDPIYTTTDYLPWVGTSIHGLIALENL